MSLRVTMSFRRIVYMKDVVFRSSCFRQADFSGQCTSPVCGNIIQQQSRCLSTHSSVCTKNNQRQTLHNSRLGNIVQKNYLPPNWQPSCLQLRSLHQSAPSSADDKKNAPEKMIEDDDDEPIVAKYDESGKPLSNWARMKMMMKTYGYVVIPVHWVIAPAWFGMFYYIVKMGVDIGPMLLKIGVSEDHVHSLQNSSASNALMAYALYKIVTPLRYTITVGATEMTVRYLRRHGYIKPHPPKEKTYRASLQETVSGMKDKAQDMKDKAQEKAQDLKGKAQDVKDKAQEKARDKAQEYKDRSKS